MSNQNEEEWVSEDPSEERLKEILSSKVIAIDLETKDTGLMEKVLAGQQTMVMLPGWLYQQILLKNIILEITLLTNKPVVATLKIKNK